jgi:hypothetical protein
VRPNTLPLSCRTDRFGMAAEPLPAVKNAAISGPRSGVSYSGLLGRYALLILTILMQPLLMEILGNFLQGLRHALYRYIEVMIQNMDSGWLLSLML